MLWIIILVGMANNTKDTHPTPVAEMIVLEIQTRTEGSPRTAHSRKSGSGVLLWSGFFHIVLLISFLASGRSEPFFQPA